MSTRVVNEIGEYLGQEEHRIAFALLNGVHDVEEFEFVRGKDELIAERHHAVDYRKYGAHVIDQSGYTRHYLLTLSVLVPQTQFSLNVYTI